MAHIIKAFTLVVSFSYCVALVLAVPQSNQSGVKIEVRVAEEKPAEWLTEAIAKNTGGRVYLHREVIITNKDMVEARAFEDPDKDKRSNAGLLRGSYNIEVVLTKDGAEKLSKATEKYLGKLMVILIDGEVIVASRVRGRINGKTVRIIDFTKEEAERIARGINRQ